MKEFDKTFTEVDFSKSDGCMIRGIQLPLDIEFDEYGKFKNKPQFLIVRPVLYYGKTIEELDRNIDMSAMQTLLSAGCNRNIMVYDASSQNYFSNRLYALLNMTSKRMSVSAGKITDVFFKESTPLQKFILDYDVNLHFIKDEEFEFVQSYYESNLKATLVENKNNLVIGIHKNMNFVKVIFKPIAYNNNNKRYEAYITHVITNNSQVILGCY